MNIIKAFRDRFMPSSPPFSPSGFTMQDCLAHCSKRNIEINTVIDVGASNGMWSDIAINCFPDAAYLLIEAQLPHENDLRRFTSRHPKMEYIIAAAGDVVGNVHFHNGDLFGGCAGHSAFGDHSIVVPCVTIDSEVAKRRLPGPFLIKLDTHGFEREIFEGAAETLKRTEVIVVETYNFRLRPSAFMFHEMCDYLSSSGFRCIDMCDLLRRPKDNVLWQMDMIFARSESKEFESNTY